jgi:D-xylonolactonase
VYDSGRARRRHDPETSENAVTYETDDVPFGGVAYEADSALSLGIRGRVERLVPGEETTDVTSDAERCRWAARWDGGRLVRYDPAGRPVGEVAFPGVKVSSLAFTGPGRTELDATTALTDADRTVEGEGASALFRVRDLGAASVPAFRSRIAVDRSVPFCDAAVHSGV